MPTFDNVPSRSPAASRHRRWWIAPLVVILLILIAFLFPWKLNFLRETIAKKVENGTGRSFAIGGDVWLYWLQGPRVTIDGLQLGNPSWASTPQMATVDHVDATVSLANLLHGRLVLKTLKVSKPVANLEVGPDNKRNWLFDKQQSDSGSSVVIDRLAIDQGRVAYLDKGKDTNVDAELGTVTGANVDTKGGGATNGISAKATGTWNGLKLAVDAQGGDVLKLQDTDTPYPFGVKATIGASHVAADGTITGLAALKAADLKVALSGDDLSEWYRITGIGLPATPHYETSGHVVIENGVYRYDDFKGTVGSSDIAGSVAFEKRPARPFVRGVLVSKQLDLKDLAPLTGKKPEPAVAPRVVDATKPEKLLPQQTFSTDKWKTLDADVRFTGESIKNAGSIPFDHLDMHVTMQDGVLAFTPLSFGFADGKMGGNFRFDGSSQPMHATVDARFTDLSLARLTPKVTDTSKASFGRLNGTLKVDGHGDSIASMLATSNGSAQIAMGRGESSSLLLELIGLQGPQVVRYLLGDTNSKIECAIADFGDHERRHGDEDVAGRHRQGRDHVRRQSRLQEREARLPHHAAAEAAQHRGAADAVQRRRHAREPERAARLRHARRARRRRDRARRRQPDPGAAAARRDRARQGCGRRLPRAARQDPQRAGAERGGREEAPSSDDRPAPRSVRADRGGCG